MVVIEPRPGIWLVAMFLPGLWLEVNVERSPNEARLVLGTKELRRIVVGRA